jgi:hypothetical protein
MDNKVVFSSAAVLKMGEGYQTNQGRKEQKVLLSKIKDAFAKEEKPKSKR